MKILLSWLNDYGDFADPADPDAVQRLADVMTGLGLTVEASSSSATPSTAWSPPGRRGSNSIPTRPRCSASFVDIR